ncbi:MAG: PH domain-containing protein [Deltaproteobacteria bacterium]|nr:PH domain-containing protein [Deltaproteobacteria bacterium]
MKVYRSKVDGWLKVVLVLPFVAGVAVTILGLTEGPASSAIVGVATFAGYALLLGGLVVPMRYAIDGDGLHVRSGAFFRIDIPWSRLHGAAPSRDPRSSPALSLDRIAVEYERPNGRRAKLLISPEDRDAFLRDLTDASAQLRLVDGRAVRSA